MATYKGTFLLVNGAQTYVPTEISVTIQKLSRPDAGRTDDGRMHPNFLARKRSVTLTWKDLPPDVEAEIVQAFDPEDSDSFTCTYWDPKSNTMQTREFYSGDISTNILSWSTNWKRYETLSFNIIEI